jgi:hypothetical protein
MGPGTRHPLRVGRMGKGMEIMGTMFIVGITMRGISGMGTQSDL